MERFYITEEKPKPKFDYDLLHKMIVEYAAYKYQQTPYIFMNSELANDLMEYNKEYFQNDFVHQFYNLRSKYNHSCSQGMLLGCKVYYDDDLNYGEIELR